MRDNNNTSVEVRKLKKRINLCDRMHSKHGLRSDSDQETVCLPSCILARCDCSDCASSAKSIAFDDCSDVSEKIMQVTVPS